MLRIFQGIGDSENPEVYATSSINSKNMKNIRRKGDTEMIKVCKTFKQKPIFRIYREKETLN